MGLYRAGGALLALALVTIAAPAFADDGTYLGTLTFNANQPGDARHVCPGTGAMKLTVAGDKIQYESIARGARAAGNIKDDGSFSASGSYGAGDTSATTVVDGRIEQARASGHFAVTNHNGTCAGTFTASRP